MSVRLPASALKSFEAIGLVRMGRTVRMRGRHAWYLSVGPAALGNCRVHIMLLDSRDRERRAWSDKSH